MPQGITVAAPPSTMEVAQKILAGIASQSGILSDYNKGSQVRTLAEQIGSVAELNGISVLALALQLIAYSGMSIFNIVPNVSGVPATGTELFVTAFTPNAPPATSNISIPAGTIVGTLNGVQFQTTSGVTLAAGATGITAPIIAVNGGLNGNVQAGSINQLLTGLVYPISVTNVSGTSGGLDPETSSQAMTRLAAKFASLIGGSPVSVANAAIGVTASGSSETVVYSTCYEGWADPNSPNYPNTAGFNVYIDNGSGSASAGLISAVQTKLNGNFNTATPSYRPGGVPYSVFAVQPVFADVVVSGSLGPLSIAAQVTGAIATAVSGYFTLPFGVAAGQPQLAATVANAALGQLSSLIVALYYTASPGAAVQIVSGSLYSRIVLGSLVVNVS